MSDLPADRQEFPNSDSTFQSGFEPGDLDFGSGEALWSRIDNLCADGGPGEHLDAAMAGKAAPRTWLIVHPPGRGELSAAVALETTPEARSYSSMVRCHWLLSYPAAINTLPDESRTAVGRVRPTLSPLEGKEKLLALASKTARLLR